MSVKPKGFFTTIAVEKESDAMFGLHLQINDQRAWSQHRDLGTERTTGLRKESASYVKVIPTIPKPTKGQAIETHLALLQ